MKKLTILSIIVLFALSPVFGASKVKRYLYISSPDGSQSQGRSQAGILIFDIDNGHEFVRRIDIPIFEEGLRGFTGNAKNHCVYYSTTNRRLGCFDIEKDTVVWDRVYKAGCDRSSITPDGKKIYAPTGFWYAGEDAGLLVVDAKDGKLLKRITVGPKAHNSIVSLDGRFAYLGTDTMLTVFDTSSDTVVYQIKDVGERGVFPYTINSKNTIAYVCLGNHVGFDVVDLKGERCSIVFLRVMSPSNIVRTARGSRPMKRSCGSVISRARSCLSSMRHRCLPRPRDTSICLKADTVGSVLVWTESMRGATHRMSSMSKPKNSSPP